VWRVLWNQERCGQRDHPAHARPGDDHGAGQRGGRLISD
jgi:hypothetical protein